MIQSKCTFKEPREVTWDLKAKQMGLQKEDLSVKMVEELDLTCTPKVYLEETEKLHHKLFPDVRLNQFSYFYIYPLSLPYKSPL